MAAPVSGLHRRLRLADVARTTGPIRLAADEAERTAIAGRLGLQGLGRLEGELDVRPWLDGAQVSGRFDAEVTYECGVTLDPFDAAVDGEIDVKLVPHGSPNAVRPRGDLEHDLEAEDPPEELPGQEIDLGEVLIEQLALSLDPFPRKPDAEFEAPPSEPIESPFAVLKSLKDRK
jgi:uncharacterized metal-binding protein YceD (DUF177 family)